MTGIALNVGAHAMIHGIIPLMYMKAATVLYVAAQNLPVHSQSHHEPEDKVVDGTKNDNFDVTENEEVD